MSEIIGVTFPVPKRIMSRFFEGGKTVFIKPAPVFKELRRGMKVVFYQSQEETGFVGEATIKRMIVLDDPLKFFDTYGDAIFLTRKEVVEYVEEQEKRQGSRAGKGEGKKSNWIALELENIRKYPEPMKPDGAVPGVGKYLKE